MGLSAGTRLGPYEIVSPLGTGGMGEVYRARDSKLGRSVAIKVLPPDVAQDPEKLDRFQREAKVLASLNHPNIASIYGFEDSDKPGLVMELVEGPTLADRILAGPVPVEDALNIAKQVCDALEYAHDRGIVHRDVKPANIKLSSDGAIKLLDFGLAKALEHAGANTDISSSPTFTHLGTQAGMILGTAAYMSPEQAKGRTIDRRSDVWAFGCVLFEMLTGKMVFSGETVTDTLAEIVKSEPTWSLVPPNTPKPIRALLLRCLKKDPKQRLQAIGEARIVIEEVLAGKAAPEENRAAQTPVSFMRRRSLLGWVGGFAAGATIVAAVAGWITRSSPAAMMHFSAVTSFAGVQAQPALSPDGRSVAYISNRDGHYNVYVGLVHGAEPLQITHDAAMKARPSWSPDGGMLAYAQLNNSGAWDIWEVPALGGLPRKVVLNAADPAWTPDGHSIVYQNLSDEQIWIAGTEGENAHALVHGVPYRWETEPRVSPDGRLVAFAVRATGGPYGELGVADVSTGTVRLLTHDYALALSPAWSPDSRSIYFSSSRGGTVNIWKIGAEGRGLRQITAGEGDDAEIDVSSDGKRLVFGTMRVNIGLSRFDAHAKSGEPNVKVLTTDPARNEFGPAYSLNGTRIAFFTNLKGAENESIGVADADGGNAIQLVRDSRVNLFPRWSPDGTHIVYGSNSDKNIEYRSIAVSGGAPQTIMSDAADAIVDVGRDGRLLFQKAGEIQVFDPRAGKPATLGKTPKYLGFLRWASNGSSVAYSVLSPQKNDPADGVWVTDFKTPPRQVFRGWVCWFAVDALDDIFVLKGNADLNGEVWKVKWDGSGVSRVPGTLPLLGNVNYIHTFVGNQMDVSPEGGHIVFQSQQVLQENIGIIDNVQ
ncbi:MAG TPA: LpqB family beta-propeller domain-containing protein [Terriglobales bacterium]|nr:LpqB family beta-propeller domain-containing protein [Terriglobales bacterium]